MITIIIPPDCPGGFEKAGEEDFEGSRMEVSVEAGVGVAVEVGAGTEKFFGDSLQKDAFAGDGISEGHRSTGQWSAIQRKTFLNVQISKHASIPKDKGQINNTSNSWSPDHVEEVYNIDDLPPLPYWNIHLWQSPLANL